MRDHSAGRTAMALAALGVGLAGCGADTPRGGDFDVAYDTIGGVVHVRNTGVPPRLAAEPLVTIGAPGGMGEPRPDEFGRARSVVADAEGAIYVADALAHEIRVFAPDGRHLRSLGRNGGGPGEYNSLYSLAWIGDTLAAFDPGNTRIGFLRPDGAWIGSVPYPRYTGDAMFVRFYPATADEAYIFGVRRVGERSERVFVRLSGSGLADTLTAPASPFPDASTTIVCPHPGGGGISFFETPFAPGHLATPAPGGAFATAWSAEYRIAIVTAAGDTVRVIERAYEPLPVGDAEWEAELTDFREFREQVPGARCEPSGPSRPDVKPAIRHLFFDAEGRLWVERYAPDGFDYDVFATDGGLLGTVDVPDRAEDYPPYARDGRLYQVVTDSLDVQYVKAWRVGSLERADGAGGSP